MPRKFDGIAARESLARVNVVGTSGSGKTTFARELAEILGHPAIEMDRLFWKPNWVESPDSEFFAKIEAAIAEPNWVLDGNYTRTVPLKWKNVTAVVWLDFSFPLTFGRVFRRALHRAITGMELWPGTGNRESFRRSLLSRESILLWMIQSHPKVRRRYAEWMGDPKFARIRWVRLRNPREARAFLASVASAKI